MYNDYALIKKSTLIDIGDAIRARKGTTNLIDPAEFSNEIGSIEGDASTEHVLQEKNVIGNGVVTPDEGYYGLSKVTVNVPIDSLLGHTEVESIITDGASYINTYICPNPNYSIEMEFKLHTDNVDVYDCLFGTRSGNGSRWTMRFDSGEESLFRGCRSVSAGDSSFEWYHSVLTKNDFYDYSVLKLEKNKVYINGVLQHTFTDNTSSEVPHYYYPCYLFAVNEKNDLSTMSSSMGYFNVKYVKLWDEKNNLVLDLIPVVKTDGIVCMFNKLNGAYYYNSGEGAFNYSEFSTGALIDIDMNNNGVNIGTGGSTYNAVNHNGTFEGGKFMLDEPGCLTVPTDFMSKSANKPWTVAFTMDNYVIGDKFYSRVARGNNDVPTVYFHNRETTETFGFQHKLVSMASYSKNATNGECGTLWYDQDFYQQNTSNGLTFTVSDNEKVTFVFRNDGDNTELWINGVKRCVADANLYASQYWASTFSIGNDQYDTATDGNMSHLECSMLKLWDRAITDNEIIAVNAR